MATLINGNGNNAVYAQQDADLYAGALGESTRILNVGSKLAYTIEDANTISVADGVILTKEGRRIQVDVGSVDEFTIPTGAAGVTRYYIIGYHLYTDGSANQKCETFVQLMASESETIPEAEFREGATEVYVSLYRVKQIGLNLDTITALLSVGIALTDMTDIIGDTNISGIGDGTLTGGLYAVNQNLTELSASLDVRYNPATDMLQIKINGVWTDYKKAYMQNLTVFADGQFRNGFAIGNNATYRSDYPNSGALSVVGEYIQVPSAASGYSSGSYITPSIDFTQYSQIEIKWATASSQTMQTHTISLEGVNVTGYIFVSNNVNALRIGYNTNDTDYTYDATHSDIISSSLGVATAYNIESIVIS